MAHQWNTTRPFTRSQSTRGGLLGRRDHGATQSGLTHHLIATITVTVTDEVYLMSTSLAQKLK